MQICRCDPLSEYNGDSKKAMSANAPTAAAAAVTAAVSAAGAAAAPSASSGGGASSSGSNGSQHYSLRWNNHTLHLLSAFGSLLESGQMVDTTLVCEDTSIKVHRLMLSACR